MKVKKGTYFTEEECMLLWISKGWGSRIKQDSDYFEKAFLWLTNIYICADVKDIYHIFMTKLLTFWQKHFSEDDRYVNKLQELFTDYANPFSIRRVILDDRDPKNVFGHYRNVCVGLMSQISCLTMREDGDDVFEFELSPEQFLEKIKNLRVSNKEFNSTYKKYCEMYPLKYHYKTEMVENISGWVEEAIEDCCVCDDTKIGSLRCFKCENCIYHSCNMSEYEKERWITCSRIVEAIGGEEDESE